MAQRLATQLREYDCERSSQEFKEVITKVKQERFPSMTEERLACADEEFIVYWDEVNKRVGATLPRPFVRFQLLNSHKNVKSVATCDTPCGDLRDCRRRRADKNAKNVVDRDTPANSGLS